MAKVLLLIVDVIGTAGITWLLNWFNLRPFRDADHLQWAERARILYPARAAARLGIYLVPASLVLAQGVIWRDQAPHWALAGLLALIGAIGGSYRFDRETLPWLEPRQWLRYVAAAWTIQSGVWFILLGCIAITPAELDWRAWSIAVLFVLLFLAWCWGGLVWVNRKAGLLTPAPERLRRIVAQTAERMRVRVRGVWLSQSPASLAFALPYTGDLLFTQRLLERHPDDEISAICAHELGHLQEPARMKAWRVLENLAWLVPWIFVRPLVRIFDPHIVVLLFCGTFIVRFYGTGIRRSMERRADRIAHENEVEPGAYARALARLYEDNLVPAVLPKRRNTHPDLYDRLLAAGAQPNFPRPAPPAIFTAAGFFLWVAFSVLLAMRLIQLTN